VKYKLESDHPVTNARAKAATGKTLDQWFKELDAWDGLKKGRRATVNHLYDQKVDLWWCTTIAVEYEKHHDVRKKDGGRYENKDGDKGAFLRIRKNKDIRMTFENAAFSTPTQVDAQFQDKGKGKTQLMVNHSRIQTRAEADGLRAAWAEALDQLKGMCEG
jgi:hypothetical protein